MKGGVETLKSMLSCSIPSILVPVHGGWGWEERHLTGISRNTHTEWEQEWKEFTNVWRNNKWQNGMCCKEKTTMWRQRGNYFWGSRGVDRAHTSSSSNKKPSGMYRFQSPTSSTVFSNHPSVVFMSAKVAANNCIWSFRSEPSTPSILSIT